MSLNVNPATDHRPSAPETGVVPESLRRLACLSITHETVPSERLGVIAPDDPDAVAAEIKATDRITECVVLTTCNRVEVYASTRTADDVETALSAANEMVGDPDPDDVQVYTGLDVVVHAARVACGLESAIVGEDQILGQVNRAFDSAQRKGLAEGALSRVADAIVRVGRKCRAETGINDGEVGYGSAICGCIEDALNRPPERVLIVGAGEMAETAAMAIERRWNARIDVANRSAERELTTDDGTYWPLDALGTALESVDAVVTATGASDALLTEAHAERCTPTTPVVDLANPPDVEPSVRDHPDILVTDLDELAARVRQHARSRQEDVVAVEELIDDAVDRLVERERENRAEDVLRALHNEAARMRERELERAMNRIDDGDCDPDVVLSDFASALTGRLLADPTEALRTAARNGDTDTIAAAHRLFDLDTDGGRDP